MKRILFFLLFFALPATLQAEARVVASTGWAAALARAAGAEQVPVIAPENLQHPPDYDPKPSDLLKVRDADFVLLGGFEGFAQRLRDAAGGTARIVKVRLHNSPQTVREEVLRLGELFGTQDRAAAFVREFDREYARLAEELRQHFAARGRRAVAHKFMTVWADFAGLEPAGVFGPGPLQPGELLRLAGQKPDLVLDNAHMPTGGPIAGSAGCGRAVMINFPGPGMDLLDVFRANARALMDATSE
ncbi:MAG: ABC transporter substrate-binding protein [Pseudomonadota bacterium]|nr:ABC transporter substrate-binding protein [Pseudomonadota bacterium]